MLYLAHMSAGRRNLELRHSFSHLPHIFWDNVCRVGKFNPPLLHLQLKSVLLRHDRLKNLNTGQKLEYLAHI